MEAHPDKLFLLKHETFWGRRTVLAAFPGPNRREEVARFIQRTNLKGYTIDECREMADDFLANGEIGAWRKRT